MMVRNESKYNPRWVFVALLTALTIVLIAGAGIAVTRQVVQARQRELQAQRSDEHLASHDSLTTEQLAVYRAALAVALGDTKCNKQGGRICIGILYGEGGVNLSDRINALDSRDTTDCPKGLNINRTPQSEVHRFRVEDITQLGNIKLRLVDPDQRMKWILDHNPDDARREGRAVVATVDDGFEYGLTNLSDIHFDKNHTHALVSVSYVCGKLCGNGATMLLEKINGAWKIKHFCGSWIS